MHQLCQLFRSFCIFAMISLSGCQYGGPAQFRDVSVADFQLATAVPPFSGDPQFVVSATQTCIDIVKQQEHFYVILPRTIENAAPELYAKAQEGRLSVAEAQVLGKKIKADFVVIGGASTYNNGEVLVGFSSIRLVDTRKGEVVASSEKFTPPPLTQFVTQFAPWTLQQQVDQAVQFAARDILRYLKSSETQEQIKLWKTPSGS